MKPIAFHEFSPAALFNAHPPAWRHPNKQAIFGLVAPRAAGMTASLRFSRWSSGPLPSDFDLRTEVVSVPDKYSYPPAAKGHMEWHVNFADPELFGFYGGPLFAQDEIQVMEHPALAALREALIAAGEAARTVESGRPTPVLVQGVPRMCAVDPTGIYGNAFSRASAERVLAAVSVLVPPTISNVIAMAAPRGFGTYDAAAIEMILQTAYTAFSAAQGAASPRSAVTIHTGFWGCGAFGGNRTVMVALQALAAGMARVERIVFHAVDQPGQRECESAMKVVSEIVGASSRGDTRKVIESMAARNFQWGHSDGN